MLDDLAGFTSYTLPPPHGVWRMLTTLGYPPSPDTAFWYSRDSFALSCFVQKSGNLLSLSNGIIAKLSSDSDNSMHISRNVWVYENSYILYRSEGKDDTKMGYYLGWFELPHFMHSEVDVPELPADFTIDRKSDYIDIYSSQSPTQLLSWYNSNEFKDFEIKHNDENCRRKISSPVCQLCYGIHRKCPLSSITKPHEPIVPTSRKRSLSDDGSFPDANPSSIAKQPRTSFSYSHRHALLVRDELVQKVVTRVEDDHFILVSHVLNKR